MREAGADPARALAPAHQRVAGVLRVPARRRRDRRRGAEPGAPLLKDRIYLGYQETSDLVEVISYNEAAGRFEFQVVRDYREGGARQVVYARRAMCAACHQNRRRSSRARCGRRPTPTRASPRRSPARRQRGTQPGRYHGVPIHRGVDVPNAIDAATDRANLLGAWQLLWRAGCGDGAAGARCRSAALVAALQYRLTDERAFDERSPAWRDELAPALGRAWNARWPAGLAIPSPDIPNRDPLPPEGARPVTGLAAAHVPAAFEPLAPRAPLEVWTAPGPETARRLVAGLAGFVTAAESRALDRQLAARAERERPAERRHEAPCELAWTDARAHAFKCVAAGDAPLRVAGRLYLRGTRVAGGEVGTIVVGGAPPIEHLEVAAGTFDARAGRDGVHRRYPHDADAARRRSRDNRNQHGVESARGACPGCGARGLGACDLDRRRRLRAGARRARGARGGARRRRPARCAHFRAGRACSRRYSRNWGPGERVVLRGRLASAAGVVEAPEPPMPADGAAAPFAAFYPLCASCHATAERSPPNFLAGPPERVAASVKHCAPRIYARLGLWRERPATRDKTPMPPPLPSARGDVYEPPPAIAGLERTASELVRAESGAAPRLETLLTNGYERLRPCLPG